MSRNTTSGEHSGNWRDEMPEAAICYDHWHRFYLNRILVHAAVVAHALFTSGKDGCIG